MKNTPFEYKFADTDFIIGEGHTFLATHDGFIITKDCKVKFTWLGTEYIIDVPEKYINHKLITPFFNIAIDPSDITNYINKQQEQLIMDLTKPEKTIEEQLTFGQKAVGISFNPSKDSAVDRCKQMFANCIDQMHALRNQETATAETKRLASIAITELQGAQMWAVKALTWKD